MLGIESMGGTAQAVALIGVVLVEAIVLHVGYDRLTDLAGPMVKRALAE